MVFSAAHLGFGSEFGSGFGFGFTFLRCVLIMFIVVVGVVAFVFEVFSHRGQDVIRR